MKLVRVFPNLSAENKSAYRNRQEAIITCISPVFYLISRNDNQADKMKIIADNTVPYLKGILEPIADVSYLDSKEFTPTNIKDADALIVRSIDKCTRELLEGSRVRLITTATIGYDHIDIHYCEKAGITWKNAPGCNAASVGQYVLSSLVAVALRKGERLAGKTIGIVGVGHVGSIVERLCEAMGMRVLRNDPPRAELEGEDGFVSLDTIAKEADIITLHVPLTKEGRFATRHLADPAFFDRLERKPWFINSCRGAVHDTQALLQAKRTGKVSELIIDCWENEPVLVQLGLDTLGVDLLDPGVGVDGGRLYPHLPSSQGYAGQAHGLQGHGAQGHRDLLSRGEQHIHLPLGGVGVDLLRLGNEIVCSVSLGGEDHNHVVPRQIGLCDDAGSA